LFIGSIVFMSSLAVLTVNVILRQFFSSSLTFAEEYMRYAIIWVTFLGCALCAEEDLHVGIDIFVQMSPPAARKLLKSLAMACATFFSAYMVHFSWRSTMLLLRTGQKSPIMLLPMGFIYLSMPVGMVLTTLQFGRKLVKYLRMPAKDFADKNKDDSGGADDIDLLTLN
jgi:C4-dicarboxylate transporter DctQ subunit